MISSSKICKDSNWEVKIRDRCLELFSTFSSHIPCQMEHMNWFYTSLSLNYIFVDFSVKGSIIATCNLKKQGYTIKCANFVSRRGSWYKMYIYPHHALLLLLTLHWVQVFFSLCSSVSEVRGSWVTQDRTQGISINLSYNVYF